MSRFIKNICFRICDKGSAMNSSDLTQQTCEDVCDPIQTVDSLLNFRSESFMWCNLVEPLVQRSSPRFLHHKYYSMDYGSGNDFETEFMRPEVIVCHDYKGNYLDDRFLKGTVKYEEYRFYNWNSVDIFCYFSHNLVTIPTLQWLNAAHKNGVKVMGTFIVESSDGQRALYEKVLSSRDQVEQVARALVDISKQLKFEGWLLNIEVAVEVEKIPMLKHFVSYLTKMTQNEVANGKIIWYDSVTHDGKLNWQNELNEKNEVFFDLCDGIFTNYNWSIPHLERTSRFIETNYPNRRNDVFFGIDVFGRGQIAGFRSFETLSKISAFKFSSAIFAPGWTSETIDINIGFEGLPFGSGAFRNRFNQKFLERNDRFWSSLLPYLYIYGPRNLPFVTSFSIGSGKKLYRMGRIVKTNWFNLKLQDIQPSTPSREGFYSHHYDDAFNGGNSLSLDTTELIRLFVCELSCDDDIIFSYTFKRQSEKNDLQVNLNIFETNKHVELEVVCNHSDGLPKLLENDVMKIASFLTSNRLPFIPSKINGWETRYFLLKFEVLTKAKITDIGIKKSNNGRLLVGNFAFYSAKDLRMNFDHISVVKL